VEGIFNILKYDIISSTNDEAKNILQQKNVPDFTVITTEEQTKGRGQRRNTWDSNKSENLLFSIICFPNKINAVNQFYLSKVISLGIIEYLNTKAKDFKIKWPNDIYYKDKKICGILIENTVSGSFIKNSIIGIGLNINQKQFPDFLPDAISLSIITKETYHLQKELNLLLRHILKNYNNLKSENFDTVDKEFHRNLYKINEITEFKDVKGKFKGSIIGTVPDGRLIIQTPTEELRYYDFKEVEFI